MLPVAPLAVHREGVSGTSGSSNAGSVNVAVRLCVHGSTPLSWPAPSAGRVQRRHGRPARSPARPKPRGGGADEGTAAHIVDCFRVAPSPVLEMRLFRHALWPETGATLGGGVFRLQILKLT